jgi:CRP-like cAMP-binding protein
MNCETDKTTNSPPSAKSAIKTGRDTGPESLYDLISHQPFFKGLSPHQLQLLADSAMQMNFAAGKVIFEEGGPANRFYLILEGKIALESELEGRGTIPIETLGPGDDLGWSWLFPPYYLHFSARALAPSRTIFFYGTRLREQCEQDHEFGYQLMKRIADALVRSLRATQRRLAETHETVTAAAEAGMQGMLWPAAYGEDSPETGESPTISGVRGRIPADLPNREFGITNDA